jgi:hypothetical protein
MPVAGDDQTDAAPMPSTHQKLLHRQATNLLRMTGSDSGQPARITGLPVLPGRQCTSCRELGLWGKQVHLGPCMHKIRACMTVKCCP